MRRVIGQCNQVDFASIEHLASITEDPEKLDTSTLKRKEKFAFLFLTVALRKKIGFGLLKSVVQEVLFWGEDEDEVMRIEVRPVRDYSKRGDVAEFKRLWYGS